MKIASLIQSDSRLIKSHQHILRFYRYFRSVEPTYCPACKLRNHRILLTIREEDEVLKLIRCKCGTVYYPNAVAPDYEVVENRISFYMRIDQAEGIDSALLPLFASPELNNRPVIDVGCGLGFTSDFVRFQGRLCLAFDPSSAAQMSQNKLGIQIQQELASPSNTVTTPEKLVFCSEVIEHVEKPLEFLRNLRAVAGSDGFLILTTPNSDWIKPQHAQNTLLAMLAPSQHLFLLSPAILTNLAEQAGFAWSFTWTKDERLFLIAGPRSVRISNVFSRSEYIKYLNARLNSTSIDKIIRYRTFGYRLFKELVHSGDYIKATSLWAELVENYQEFEFNLNDPTESVQYYSRSSGEDLQLPDPEFFPYNTALLFYLRGTLLIAYDHDRVLARPFMDAAIELSDLYRNIFTKGIFQAYDLELQSVKNWALEAIKVHNL